MPRRTVYAFVNRDVISPLAGTFDAANPTTCTVKRPDTTVPQQTLHALNSEFVQNRARALVQRPDIRDAASDEERVRRIYRRDYARTPHAGEIKAALGWLAEAKDAGEAWPRFVHALLAANEFHFID